MDVGRRRWMLAGAGWTLGAIPWHAAAQQDGAGIDGVWQGALALPQGDRADFALRIGADADGRRLVRLTIPDMHAYDAAIEVLEPLGAARFRIDPFGSVVTLDGDRLGGTFAYVRVPLALSRVAALPPWSETPAPDVPEGPLPRWTRALGAPVWASPVARDGVVYVGDAGGTMHALRVGDGAPVWTHAHGTPIFGDAAVDRDGVAYVDQRGTLTRLDRHSGRTRWQVALDGGAAMGADGKPGDFTFTHRTPRPALDGDVMYVGGRDRSVRALGVADGRVRWRTTLEGAVMSGIAVEGARLIAGTFDRDGVVALDRAGGRVLWTFATAQPVSSMPAVAGEIVLAGCRDFAIHGLALDSGASQWTHSYIFSWVESTPAIVGGIAYFGSSDLRSVRAVAARSGRTLWTTDVRGLTWGTPAVDGDRVYAGTAGQSGVLVAHRPGWCAIDRRTGALLWRRELPMGAAPMAGFASSLCLAGRTLVGAAVDGTVYAIPLDG